MTTTTVSFDEPALARAVEGLSEEEIDNLPFGATKLDTEGHVVFYSKAEQRLSGRKKRPTVGLNYFLTVAPCMSGPDFKGRIDAAAAAGEVDIELGWTGDFADREREVIVRIQSASDGGLWIFISRDV
jgi:photoactive yellow protein